MTTKKAVLDTELQRVLDIAAEMTPLPNELHSVQQNQSSWPWQVRQLPTYTTDHIPG
jgi:hypothetical protein